MPGAVGVMIPGVVGVIVLGADGVMVVGVVGVIVLGVNEFLMQACSKINVTMLNSNNFAQHEYVLKNVPQFAMSSLFYVSHCKTPPTSSLK